MDREIAPFIRKNGMAIMVSGVGGSAYTVEAPNIRLKRPFTPSEALFNRRPGGVIFSPTAGSKYGDFRATLADDMMVMESMIVNAEEYLCAMALQGAISYSEDDEEVFTITFAKPAANNITLSTFWNDGTPANVRVHANIRAAQAVVADAGEAPLTDAICGSEAAAELDELVESGNLKMLGADGANVSAGTYTFLSQFQDDGALYMGSLNGIRFWRYSRTATLNGVSTAMVRAKYVEFISTSASSDRVLYYGAIPDVKALQGRNFVGTRFAKSWEIEDPSALMSLVHSRPLPVPRRPAANVSMKVISG
jgi:hypothetical protein